MKSKLAKVNALYINEENPRDEPQENEAAAIKILLKKERKFFNLMKSIAKYGFDITEKIIIVEAETPYKYKIMDGNRRISCIKLLNDPEFLPSDIIERSRLVKRIKKIIRENNYTPILEVESVLYDIPAEKELMERIIQNKHTGENDGAGRLQWDYKAQNRFMNDDYKNYLVEFLDNVLKVDRSFSTMERIFGDPDMRTLLGVLINKKEPSIKLVNYDSLKKIYFILYLIKSKQINVSDIYYKDDRKGFYNKYFIEDDEWMNVKPLLNSNLISGSVPTEGEDKDTPDASIEGEDKDTSDASIEGEDKDTPDASIEGEDKDTPDASVEGEDKDTPDASVEGEDKDTPDASVEGEDKNTPDASVEGEDKDTPDASVEGEDKNTPDASVEGEDKDTPDASVEGEDKNTPDASVEGEDKDTPDASVEGEDKDTPDASVEGEDKSNRGASEGDEDTKGMQPDPNDKRKQSKPSSSSFLFHGIIYRGQHPGIKRALYELHRLRISTHSLSATYLTRTLLECTLQEYLMQNQLFNEWKKPEKDPSITDLLKYCINNKPFKSINLNYQRTLDMAFAKKDHDELNSISHGKYNLPSMDILRDIERRWNLLVKHMIEDLNAKTK
ncbi:hypothetical protein [Bacillus velezensis]|uniref:hypothetical protein n=1 Tax=Bacillus velezensis TaxID=492670 RepID=UPI0035934969